MHSDIFCQLGIVRCKICYTLFMFTVLLVARGGGGGGGACSTLVLVY